MWHVKFLQFALLVSIAAARAQSDIYSPFLEPLLGESFNPDNTTLPQLELLKRQTSTTNCPSNHINCGYAGNSGVCCRNTANCAVDTAGHVACCPLGAVCTGQIAGTAVAGGGAATTTGTSTGTSFVFASSTTTSNNAAGTVIIGGGASGTQTGFTFTTGTGTTSGAARSYVTNPYNYPFAYIPTTYANAGACSSAYTSCQSQSTSCSAYLAGIAGYGVTVSAPNGGVTMQGPTTSYVPAVASSVCSSLSQAACSGLVVQACGNFGTGGGSANMAGARCTGAVRYGAGMGIAMGLAGQAMGYR